MNATDLNEILRKHKLWLDGDSCGECADLRDADLRDAELICVGNMREIKSLQIDKWPIAYTSEDMQIGCQKHAIEKWRKWDTPAGRKWVSAMDEDAAAWADKHLALVLQFIDASPATPTGVE